MHCRQTLCTAIFFPFIPWINQYKYPAASLMPHQPAVGYLTGTDTICLQELDTLYLKNKGGVSWEMKKQIGNPLVCAGFAAALAIAMLMGCAGEKKVDYHIDGVEKEPQTDGDSPKGTIAQFAEETAWNEIWNIEEGVEETVHVTVDAQVLVPDVKEMYVVEVTVPKFDVAFKERAVKIIFGGEDVSCDDETDEYTGKMDGITYTLRFDEHFGEEGYYTDSQWFSLQAKNFEEICPEEYEGYVHHMEHPYMFNDVYMEAAENECKLSLQEAEKIARNFLEEFGLEYPVLAYTKPLIWGDETLDSRTCNKWPANGYVFTYNYGVENVSFTDLGYSYVNLVMEEGKIPRYSMYASATVYVTDKGVIFMVADNPVETVSISDSVELLPLDTIKEIMKEEMTNRYGDFRFIFKWAANELEFTHMELIYFRVNDKENPERYSYVPAWRLSEQIGQYGQWNSEIRNPVIINAIDGSVISIFDEI